MEDAHTALLTLPPNGRDYSFFGVYDGHGGMCRTSHANLLYALGKSSCSVTVGQNVARYSGAHLHEKILNQPLFKENIRSAIEGAFLGTDEDLKNGKLSQSASRRPVPPHL